MKPNITKPKISITQSCQLRAMHQVLGIKMANIVKDPERFPGFAKLSPATIYKHAKKPLDGNNFLDQLHFNNGRPSKLSAQDLRSIKRQVAVLRDQDRTYSSKKLQMCSVGD